MPDKTGSNRLDVLQYHSRYQYCQFFVQRFQLLISICVGINGDERPSGGCLCCSVYRR
ncbi:hypothetical protein KCP71_24210 [Salmonella enterica subsp. enterica]|nr:hypothetical protein KCP71_24210 [Salmonella enterica subsp. enterica]